MLSIHTYLPLLKRKVKSLRRSDHILHKSFYYSTFVLWKVTTIPYKFLFDTEYRSLILLKYSKKDHAHQISNYTTYNRYPDLFLKSQELMKNQKDIKILSFGCSTGEEVFTLREYFPEAFIVGVDINRHNIKKAVSKNHDHKIVFSHKIDETIHEYGPFNIIFALAVFQRTQNRHENTFNSSHIYPFDKFNTQIIKLNSYLNSNGIFVIDYADYLFEDTAVTTQYRALTGEHNIMSDRFMFDAKNQRMKHKVLLHRIFIKK